jgi:predicted CopG family antitoxin
VYTYVLKEDIVPCKKMTTKTLTITEDAYNLLQEKKLKKESFSELITRLLSKKQAKEIKDFFGILK